MGAEQPDKFLFDHGTEALKEKKWTAAIEQTGEYKKLPPAVVLDVDETVLDNSPKQLERDRLVAAGFAPVSLAGNILRFETAAIIALGVVRAMLAADGNHGPAHG